jgi:osmoprotectant transport system permease protein
VDTPWLDWRYVTSHSERILAATREHVTLTVIAVVLGLLLSLPAAVLVRRHRRWRGAALGTAGVIYTIPSLAAFAALRAVFGLSTTTVIIPLTSYTLLILMRNVLAGLDGVPPDVVEAARGLGYGALRLLVRVELPLALPSIMAGIRIATVSTIALVTVGALVGKGGLGALILEGLNSLYRTEIGTTTLLVVALAVVADAVLLGLQWLLTPWQRSRP